MSDPALPQTLVEAITGGTLVPFVGAGVSMAVQRVGGERAFPSWHRLLELAAERLEKEGRPEHAVVRGMLGLSPPRYLEAARYAREGLGGQWAGFLRQALGVLRGEVDDTSLALARRAWRLGSRLVITTNYDRMLRWSCPEGEDLVEWQVEEPAGMVDAMRGTLAQPAVWHLHGSTSDPTRIILCPDGYERLYAHDAQQRSYEAALTALRNLMTTRHVLFVGFSLDDAFLVRQLEWVRDTFAGYGSRHYVLARAAEIDRMRSKVEGLDVDFIGFQDFGAPMLTKLDELIAVRGGGAEQAAAPVPEPEPKSTPAVVASPSPVPDDELARYLAAIEALHRELPLAGFETRARVSIELDDLHVPLDAVIDRGCRRRRVFSSAQQAADSSGESKPHSLLHESTRIPLAEAFVELRARGHEGQRGVVLLGDPGSGKTTHLRQVLLKVVRDGPASIGLPEGTVPVFLPLRDLRDRSQGLRGFVRQQLRAQPLGMAPDFGQRLLDRGTLLFLLDGLDEVADADERAEVAQWVDDARKVRTSDYFLMTCRYAGYSPDLPLDAGFLELHLRPMTDAQVEAFVRKWYRIVEQATRHEPERAEGLADDLLDAIATPELAASRRVNEMTRNPLLLTAICLVHRDRGELPTRRATLYYEATQVLLERWRKVTKRLPVSFPAVDARKALQPAALWMHGEEGRTRATAAELEPSVRQGLVAAGHRDVPVERFLQAIRDESGLLTGWDVSQYGFMHLGFQEYLAARELRARGFGDEAVLREIAGRFGESWWQEVILLMVALDEPAIFEKFMRVLVEQPGFVQWVGSSTMRLLIGEAAGVTAAPLVELVKREARAGEQGLAERQLAALRLLSEVMPGEVEGLGEVLRRHPVQEVRQWWRRRGEGGQVGSEGVEVVVLPGSGYELVRIPGGRFLMGSPPGVGLKDEWPQQEVELASFFMGRYPVTNAQYERFLEANPDVPKPAYWGDRRFNQPEQPVVGVSWHEAKQYCAWAGPNLTLPTEAQWEYACRAGTTTLYSFGDDVGDLDRFGWYDDNSGGQTQPVGQKEPNQFGLYDMHGNVLEWCEDGTNVEGVYLEAYETTTPRPGDSLRREPEGGANRVIRGGSWFVGADRARSAFRYFIAPGVRAVVVGFRPVQVIPGSFTPSPAPSTGKA